MSERKKRTQFLVECFLGVRCGRCITVHTVLAGLLCSTENCSTPSAVRCVKLRRRLPHSDRGCDQTHWAVLLAHFSVIHTDSYQHGRHYDFPCFASVADCSRTGISSKIANVARSRVPVPCRGIKLPFSSAVGGGSANWPKIVGIC